MTLPQRHTKRSMERKKALAHIQELITEADARFAENPRISHRHARKAKRLAMKHKLRLASSIKRRICKGCFAFLVPGRTCRIRTQRGHVVIYCTACKRMTRVGYEKRKTR